MTGRRLTTRWLSSAVSLLLLGHLPIVQAIHSSFDYTLQTNVSDFLRLALDVRDMRVSELNVKKDIYENSRHSRVSLASLSLTAQQKWKDVPLYILYKDTFEDLGEHHEDDVSGRFDDQPVEQYADTLVQDLFGLDVSNLEGTAAVVFNVLMDYFGYLWKTLKSCQQQSSITLISESLDIAVALYIGESQVRTQTQSGYLLYNIAQFAGSQFGQDLDDGESLVNTQTLTLLLALQADIQQGSCATGSGILEVQGKIRLLYQNAFIVLIQMLLHSIEDVVDNGTPSDFVEVFSLAVLPVIRSCDRSAYDTLVNLTVSQDMTEQSRSSVLAALQRSYGCFGISCDDVGAYLAGLIPSCVDPASVPDVPYPALAGYTPSSDVRHISYLDLDLRQMKSFMEFASWPAAIDYYEFGWNSDMYSLKGLASGDYLWLESQEYLTYETFYKSSSHADGIGFANDLIRNALLGVAHFAAIDDINRMGVVVGAIQSMAFYLGIRGQIYAAIQECRNQRSGQAALHWDSAAALFVGSIEGGETGGRGNGQSLYAASKEFCAAFETCEPTGSISTTVLMASFQAGSTAIDECEVLQNIDRDSISNELKVILIQGLLYYAYKAAENSLIGARGYFAAYTVSLFPLVTSAVDNADPVLARGLNFANEVDVASVFAIVKESLPSLGIDCASIGKLEIQGTIVGVCTSDPPPPLVVSSPSVTTPVSPIATRAPVAAPAAGGGVLTPVRSPSSMAWGRYPFVNEDLAMKDSLFTLDIKDMWFSDTPAAAQYIYEGPSTHATTGLSGTALIRSLQDFSTEASLIMSQDPAYNFFRVALFEDSSLDIKATGVKNGWPYGDAVEGLALGEANGNSAQLGSEAAIVMEIWMMIVHRLYEAVRSCENGVDSANLVDSAVGLWIGQEQQQGDANSGWSVYSLAEGADELYGSPSSGEADVNTMLMQQFVTAQRLAKSCAGNAQNTESIRRLVDEMVKNLSIPLLRHLLFHMSDNNFAYVELYALSFIPLTISVDELAFDYLRNGLFEGFDWDTSLDTELLELLGKSLHSLRFTCADLGNTSNASEKLQGLISVICDEINETYETNFLAAYEATTDVKELARIDLDVLQIDLFMRAKAYDLALNVYQNGRNSRKSDGTFNTLQEMASIEQGASTQLYEIHKAYFGAERYSHTIVMEAMQAPDSSRYSGSSRLQRAKAVHTVLSSMMMYVQIVSRLRTAVDLCQTPGSADTTPQGRIDEAVALLVGSIEGPYSGGSTLQSGQMLYELGKDVCSIFDKCDPHGDSEANVNLQYAFSSMKESFDNGNCAAAASILEENILTVLPVPLIQGALYLASENEGNIIDFANTDYVEGNLLVETLLPEIATANQTSAAIIFDNADFVVGDPFVRQGVGAVFDAFTSVLSGLEIDCNLVGILQKNGMTLCSSTRQAPAPNSPTDFGNDLYVSTTNVQDRANIALDIQEMEEALSSGRIGTAQLIYMQGRNSEVYDAMGKAIDFRSLSSFSTSAVTTMKENPMYQIAVYGLRDSHGRYSNADASQYADTVVKDMFVAGAHSNIPLASEAAVALNLWMELANELFQAVRNCKNGVLTDDDGIHSFDEAAAYWIGDGQIAGDGEQGHLLYALAEQMGDHFSLTSGDQATTNFNILRLFQEIKLEVSISNGCTGNAGAHRRISRMVGKLTSQMLAVNIQALIHFLRQGDMRDRVRIYAHAVIPLISGCNHGSFQILKERLLDASYRDTEVDNIISMIRSTFSCFDLKCDDVGIHTTESPTVCSDPQGISSLAGYRPANDVSEYARFDLDIKQMDILVSMRAYEAASDIYSFGKHVAPRSEGDGTALSLERLATATGRSVVPQYESYRRFFDDEDYANTIVMRGFVDNLSNEQRRPVVVTASQSMIMYMAALQEMHDAINTCSSTDFGQSSSSALSWDMAAAYLIGYLEGSEDAGSNEGRFIFGLSKQLCYEFGTCSAQTPGSSMTNEKLETLLYSGRGAITGGSCGELQRVVKAVETLVMVPLMQALLSATASLVQGTKNNKAKQAEAYVFAQALLPLIANVDRQAAKIIRKNFPLTGSALSDGVNTVMAQLAGVLPALDIDCKDVGSNDVVDPCTGIVTVPKKDKVVLAVFVILGCLTVFAVCMLLRSKMTNSSDAPTFVRSKGELNHTSELLAGLKNKTSPQSNCNIQSDISETMLENSVAVEDEPYVDAIQQATGV